MKRLLIATDNFLPRHDGVVRFLIETLPFLKKRFSITLIVPQYKGKTIDIPGVRLVYIPTTKHFAGDFPVPKFHPMTILKTVRKADVVFTQTLGPIGATALFFAHTLRKPTASFIHSLEWELFIQAKEFGAKRAFIASWTKRFVKFLFRKNQLLIIPSQRIADALGWQGIHTPKRVVHLAVDANRFAPSKDVQLRHQERKRLGIADDEIVIGYHGRLANEKDLPTLLRAFVRLRNRYSQCRLLVVGSGIPRLEALFKDQPGVIHIPATNDVEHYLRLMDVYCLPSLTETTSLSTLEAMSTGLAVVATRVGFVKDYIQDGTNGLFFKMKDSHDLATQLERLCTQPSLRHRLGTQARMSVTRQFNWAHTGEQLCEMLDGISKI